jgi:hypothetical protein
MTSYDDEFTERVASLALGVLPEGEALATAAHLRTCANCRAEYDSLRAVANLVGLEAEVGAGQLDELADARLKTRVMRAVRGQTEGTIPQGGPLAASPRRRGGWHLYAAAAALALAILTSLDAAVLHLRNAEAQSQIALLRQEAASRGELEQRLAQLAAPGAKHFAIAGGEVVESKGRVVIALAYLPPAPSGKVYQAWTFARGKKTPTPSVTFTPDSTGGAFVELPESAVDLTAIAVTVEPPGGSRAPTSKPSFVRALS